MSVGSVSMPAGVKIINKSYIFKGRITFISFFEIISVLLAVFA